MVSCWEKVQKMLNTQLAENNNKKVMSLSQTSIFYKVYAIGWSPHVSFLRVKKWISLNLLSTPWPQPTVNTISHGRGQHFTYE